MNGWAREVSGGLVPEFIGGLLRSRDDPGDVRIFTIFCGRAVGLILLALGTPFVF